MIPMLLTLALASVPVIPDGGSVVMKGQKFLAEVARTPQEHARGLMYRQSLAKDRCMFFIYDEDGNRSIWMKNCLISLDVIWVGHDGTVMETQENVPPCSTLRGDDCPSYGGTVLARHFVEFPKGTLHRLSVHKGDKIGWNLILSDGGTEVGGLPVPADPAKGKKARSRKK